MSTDTRNVIRFDRCVMPRTWGVALMVKRGLAPDMAEQMLAGAEVVARTMFSYGDVDGSELVLFNGQPCTLFAAWKSLRSQGLDQDGIDAFLSSQLLAADFDGEARLMTADVDDLRTLATMADDGDKRWITIGGGPGQKGEKHVGGFPVQIKGDGTIVSSGAPGLQGKKIGEVRDHFQKVRADSNKKASDDKENRRQVQIRNKINSDKLGTSTARDEEASKATKVDAPGSASKTTQADAPGGTALDHSKPTVKEDDDDHDFLEHVKKSWGDDFQKNPTAGADPQAEATRTAEKTTGAMPTQLKPTEISPSKPTQLSPGSKGGDHATQMHPDTDWHLPLQHELDAKDAHAVNQWASSGSLKHGVDHHEDGDLDANDVIKGWDKDFQKNPKAGTDPQSEPSKPSSSTVREKSGDTSLGGRFKRFVGGIRKALFARDGQAAETLVYFNGVPTPKEFVVAELLDKGVPADLINQVLYSAVTFGDADGLQKWYTDGDGAEQGKDIPKEVMADYPDLAGKAAFREEANVYWDGHPRRPASLVTFLQRRGYSDVEVITFVRSAEVADSSLPCVEFDDDFESKHPRGTGGKFGAKTDEALAKTIGEVTRNGGAVAQVADALKNFTVAQLTKAGKDFDLKIKAKDLKVTVVNALADKLLQRAREIAASKPKETPPIKPPEKPPFSPPVKSQEQQDVDNPPYLPQKPEKRSIGYHASTILGAICEGISGLNGFLWNTMIWSMLNK